MFILNWILPTNDFSFSRNLGATWTIPMFIGFYILSPLLVKLGRNYKDSIIVLFSSFVVSAIQYYFLHGWFSIFRYLPFFMMGVFIFNNFNKAFQKICVFITLIVIFDSIGFVKSSYINSFIAALSFSILIIVFSNLDVKTPGIFNKIVNYSYEIYLVQGIVFEIIIDRIPMPNYMIVVISIVLTIFVSYIIKEFIEEPIQRKILLKVNN